MGKPKIKVAIYNNDMIIQSIKDYEISESGDKIRIVSGGEGHWMPEFDKNSCLDFPRLKRFFFFGKRQYQRLYFVRRRGAKCVDFSTGVATGPDIEQLEEANKKVLLSKIGQDAQQIPLWLTVTLIINTLFLLLILNALGVF